MSSDAHVVSNRLHAPASLASRGLAEAQRRRALRLGASSSTVLSAASGWSPSRTSSNAAAATASSSSRVGTNSAYNEARMAGMTFAGSSSWNGRMPADAEANAQGDGNADADKNGSSHYLDLERFEDWENPTLDALYPDIKIDVEDQVFGVAVAEDGETLPSELHPSHPYGDLHQPKQAYISKSLFGKRRGEDEVAAGDGIALENGMIAVERHDKKKRFTGQEAIKIPAHLVTRSRQNFIANAPHWPFKRFGPGQGGPGALVRHELQHPWRPYRSAWSDLDFASLATHATNGEEVLQRSRQMQRLEVGILAGEDASQTIRDEIDALVKDGKDDDDLSSQDSPSSLATMSTNEESVHQREVNEEAQGSNPVVPTAPEETSSSTRSPPARQGGTTFQWGQVQTM